MLKARKYILLRNTHCDNTSNNEPTEEGWPFHFKISSFAVTVIIANHHHDGEPETVAQAMTFFLRVLLLVTMILMMMMLIDVTFPVFLCIIAFLVVIGQVAARPSRRPWTREGRRHDGRGRSRRQEQIVVAIVVVLISSVPTLVHHVRGNGVLLQKRRRRRRRTRLQRERRRRRDVESFARARRRRRGSECGGPHPPARSEKRTSSAACLERTLPVTTLCVVMVLVVVPNERVPKSRRSSMLLVKFARARRKWLDKRRNARFGNGRLCLSKRRLRRRRHGEGRRICKNKRSGCRSRCVGMAIGLSSTTKQIE